MTRKQGVYAVFTWRADGKYRLEDAVEGSQRKSYALAAKLADKLNNFGPDYMHGGYVVRFVAVQQEPYQTKND